VTILNNRSLTAVRHVISLRGRRKLPAGKLTSTLLVLDVNVGSLHPDGMLLVLSLFHHRRALLVKHEAIYDDIFLSLFRELGIKLKLDRSNFIGQHPNPKWRSLRTATCWPAATIPSQRPIYLCSWWTTTRCGF